MAHVETPVKVNAWVDEGVVPLVIALSQHPLVVTVDSCEMGSLRGCAYVAFTAVRDLPEVAQEIADALARCGDHRATVTLEWFAGGTTPLGYLLCPPDEVESLAVRLGGHFPYVGVDL